MTHLNLDFSSKNGENAPAGQLAQTRSPANGSFSPHQGMHKANLRGCYQRLQETSQSLTAGSSFAFYAVFLSSLKALSSFWILASLREMRELEICWGQVILRPTILLIGKILLEENQERVLARPVALRYSETRLASGKLLSLKLGEQPLFTCCRTSGFCCIKCNSLWPAWIACRHRSDFLPSFAMCLKR